MTTFTDYIILKNILTFDILNKYYNQVEELSFDDTMLIGQLFRKMDEDTLSYSIDKVDSIDIFHLDEPDKIALKNKVKKRMKESIDNILLPLVNWKFTDPTPCLGEYFVIKLEDNRAIIGCHKTSYFRGDWRTDSTIINFMLIKRFILK